MDGRVAEAQEAAQRIAQAGATFAVGDFVLGRATKHKGIFHMKKARVTAVLARHYKVELLEGNNLPGQSHKYLLDLVGAFPDG